MFLWLILSAGAVLADRLGELTQGVPSLAFTRLDGGRSSIFLADVEGRKVELPLGMVGELAQAAWSPDGGSLAFVAAVEGVSQLHLLDDLDGDATQLTRALSNSHDPRWIPDGDTLVFLFERAVGRTTYDVFTLELSSGVLRNLTDDNPNSTFAVPSPAGDAVAYQFDNRQVRVVGLPYGAPLLEAQNGTRSPAWSPDGTQLAYAGPQDRFVSSVIDTIYVHPLDGGEPVRFPTPSLTGVDHPTWSPDGRQILFVGEMPGVGTPSRSLQTEALYSLDVETGEVNHLADIDGRGALPAFSPDGRYVMFVVIQGQEMPQICFYDFDRATVRCPASLVNVLSRPVWRPTPAE